MDEKIEFVAILKKTEIKSLVSGDKSVWIRLETGDLSTYDFCKWPADETVSVTICRNQK